MTAPFGLTIRAAGAAYLVVSAVLVWLALSLPPHAFYAGDSGVKLIAARNVIAHPGRPLEVDLPFIGGQRAPYLERFFQPHGDHAHALQSPVFPVLSAPFIALAGLRGAYVLPLVSFIALAATLEQTRARALPRVGRGWLIALTTVASPVLFYALEFWEHAPAIACVALATALVWRHDSTSTTPIVGGVAAGMAVLLRPEAVWYAAVLGWIAWRRATLNRTLIGIALVAAPFALANWLESGNLAGPHVAANLAPLADSWWSSRLRRAELWFSPGPPLAVAALLALSATVVVRRMGLELRRAQLVALGLAAALAIAASAGVTSQASLWRAWPAAFLLFVPVGASPQRRELWALALVPMLAIWLSSTHDGGAQWGPRFVLICVPPLVLLAAAVCADATLPGFARLVRCGLVIIVLLASVWTSRAAYRELRGTKQMYAQIVDAAATYIRPGTYVVSNVWWFDQVAAALYGSRSFLYADDPQQAAHILGRLESANAERVAVVWSRDSADGASLAGITSGSCYRFVNVQMLTVRPLSIGTAVCQRPPMPDRSSFQ